jgi:putative membrane protein
MESESELDTAQLTIAPAERSALIARRTHWATPLATLNFAFRQFLVVLAPILFNGLWWLIVPLAAALLIGRIASWWRMTYELSDEIVIRSGVFVRAERVIAGARIQQVDIERSLRHRIFGLAMVRIVGAGNSTVKVDAVTMTEARRIEAVLLNARQRALASNHDAPLATFAPPEPAPTLVAKVSTRHLFLAGLTGSAVLAAPLAAVALMSQLDEFGLDERAERWAGGLSTLVAIVAAVVFVLIVLPLIGIIRMVIANHRLTVTQTEGEIRITRGLLSTSTSQIPLGRVQRVQRNQTLLRKPLGLSTIDVSTAKGASIDATSNGNWAQLTGQSIPILPDDEVDDVLSILTGLHPLPAVDQQHPLAARRRAFIRSTLTLGIPTLAISVLVGMATSWLVLIAVPASTLLALWWSRAWFKRLGHGISGSAIVAAQGLFTLRTSYVSARNAQALVVHQSPTQRRAALATLTIWVAGAAQQVEIRDVSVSQLDALLAVVGRRLDVRQSVR